MQQHRRAFATAELRFARRHAALTFDAAQLALPVPSRDDTLARYLERLAENTLAELAHPPGASFADRVAQALKTTLEDGRRGIDAVGLLLRVSPRTMQRRLRVEGTTFAKVRQGLRRELAERLLADRDLTIEQIAGLLGYSEPSTFHRAFLAWYGTSPGAFRTRAPARASDTRAMSPRQARLLVKNAPAHSLEQK
jgi:AraC-like DNA-binding protein